MKVKKSFKKILGIGITVFLVMSFSNILPGSFKAEKTLSDETFEFTHTVLGEYATATWCGYCKYAHAALKNIYNHGWYPFYYVSLVDDKNTHAAERVDELQVTGFPTVVWDGGYKRDVGAGSQQSAQEKYNASIKACGNRTVSDIDITLEIQWLEPKNPVPTDGSTDVDIYTDLSWTDAAMRINITVKNNEQSSYQGHLRVYVTEITSSMGWQDTGGHLYTFPFLDYAFNGDISISADSSWSTSVVWDGKAHSDGHGHDFSEITQDNIMVIASIFNSGSGYVDETAGLKAGVNTDPKTYDVYFGKTNPPEKVVSNQSETTYDPGVLDFNTTYYWKIVSWDANNLSRSTPVWSFTTRNNEAPVPPHDPTPGDGETDVNTEANLIWQCSDPDDDPVTYDVYFGETNPPPKIASNQSGTIYDPGSMGYETTYYWKIVAWDL